MIVKYPHKYDYYSYDHPVSGKPIYVVDYEISYNNKYYNNFIEFQYIEDKYTVLRELVKDKQFYIEHIKENTNETNTKR